MLTSGGLNVHVLTSGYIQYMLAEHAPGCQPPLPVPATATSTVELISNVFCVFQEAHQSTAGRCLQQRQQVGTECSRLLLTLQPVPLPTPVIHIGSHHSINLHMFLCCYCSLGFNFSSAGGSLSAPPLPAAAQDDGWWNVDHQRIKVSWNATRSERHST
jgi:hypothetical protein